MFDNALKAEGLRHAGEYELLKLYLRRHIELDGDSHGPRARRILSLLCGDDSEKWDEARRAAQESLRARKPLWDGVLQILRVQQDRAELFAE